MQAIYHLTIFPGPSGRPFALQLKKKDKYHLPVPSTLNTGMMAGTMAAISHTEDKGQENRKDVEPT